MGRKNAKRKLCLLTQLVPVATASIEASELYLASTLAGTAEAAHMLRTENCSWLVCVVRCHFQDKVLLWAYVILGEQRTVSRTGC